MAYWTKHYPGYFLVSTALLLILIVWQKACIIKASNMSTVNETACIESQGPVFCSKSLSKPFSASRHWQYASSFRQGLYYTTRVKTSGLTLAVSRYSSDVLGPESIESSSHSTAPSPPVPKPKPMTSAYKTPAIVSEAPTARCPSRYSLPRKIFPHSLHSNLR
jgi:hypothetical protein